MPCSDELRNFSNSTLYEQTPQPASHIISGAPPVHFSPLTHDDWFDIVSSYTADYLIGICSTSASTGTVLAPSGDTMPVSSACDITLNNWWNRMQCHDRNPSQSVATVRACRCQDSLCRSCSVGNTSCTSPTCTADDGLALKLVAESMASNPNLIPSSHIDTMLSLCARHKNIRAAFCRLARSADANRDALQALKAPTTAASTRLYMNRLSRDNRSATARVLRAQYLARKLHMGLLRAFTVIVDLPVEQCAVFERGVGPLQALPSEAHRQRLLREINDLLPRIEEVGSRLCDIWSKTCVSQEQSPDGATCSRNDRNHNENFSEAVASATNLSKAPPYDRHVFSPWQAYISSLQNSSSLLPQSAKLTGVAGAAGKSEYILKVGGWRCMLCGCCNEKSNFSCLTCRVSPAPFEFQFDDGRVDGTSSRALGSCIEELQFTFASTLIPWFHSGKQSSNCRFADCQKRVRERAISSDQERAGPNATPPDCTVKSLFGHMRHLTLDSLAQTPERTDMHIGASTWPSEARHASESTVIRSELFATDMGSSFNNLRSQLFQDRPGVDVGGLQLETTPQQQKSSANMFQHDSTNFGMHGNLRTDPTCDRSFAERSRFGRSFSPVVGSGTKSEGFTERKNSHAAALFGNTSDDNLVGGSEQCLIDSPSAASRPLTIHSRLQQPDSRRQSSSGDKRRNLFGSTQASSLPSSSYFGERYTLFDEESETASRGGHLMQDRSVGMLSPRVLQDHEQAVSQASPTSKPIPIPLSLPTGECSFEPFAASQGLPFADNSLSFRERSSRRSSPPASSPIFGDDQFEDSSLANSATRDTRRPRSLTRPVPVPGASPSPDSHSPGNDGDDSLRALAAASDAANGGQGSATVESLAAISAIFGDDSACRTDVAATKKDNLQYAMF